MKLLRLLFVCLLCLFERALSESGVTPIKPLKPLALHPSKQPLPTGATPSHAQGPKATKRTEEAMPKATQSTNEEAEPTATQSTNEEAEPKPTQSTNELQSVPRPLPMRQENDPWVEVQYQRPEPKESATYSLSVFPRQPDDSLKERGSVKVYGRPVGWRDNPDMPNAEEVALPNSVGTDINQYEYNRIKPPRRRPVRGVPLISAQGMTRSGPTGAAAVQAARASAAAGQSGAQSGSLLGSLAQSAAKTLAGTASGTTFGGTLYELYASQIQDKIAAGGAQGGMNAADIEDCSGCRFIWTQIESDVGGTRVQGDIYAAFQKRCGQASETTMFMPVCENMQEYFDDMMVNYLEGTNVVDLCVKYMYCPS